MTNNLMSEFVEFFFENLRTTIDVRLLYTQLQPNISISGHSLPFCKGHDLFIQAKIQKEETRFELSEWDGRKLFTPMYFEVKDYTIEDRSGNSCRCYENAMWAIKRWPNGHTSLIIEFEDRVPLYGRPMFRPLFYGVGNSFGKMRYVLQVSVTL